MSSVSPPERCCPKCEAPLGPWENSSGCRTCDGRVNRNSSIATRAIAHLETSDAPLAHWDIKRALDKRWSFAHRAATVSQVLADDLRACWGGRGIYGLYRHGLLPGVRDLGRAAAVYIHAADRALTFDEIHFILRHVGYRFSLNSLEPALWRVHDLGIFRYAAGTWNEGEWRAEWHGSRSDVTAERSVARALRFQQRGPAVYTILDRAAAQVAAALTERRRRLARESGS